MSRKLPPANTLAYHSHNQPGSIVQPRNIGKHGNADLSGVPHHQFQTISNPNSTSNQVNSSNSAMFNGNIQNNIPMSNRNKDKMY